MIPAASQTGLRFNLRHFRKGVVFMAYYTYNDDIEVETKRHGNGKSVNMREIPSMDGKVITQVLNGTVLKGDKAHEINDWMPCAYADSYGFIMSKFIRGTSAYGPATISGAGNYDGISDIECKAKVAADGGVNLRATCSTSGTKITTIPNGATIYVSNSGAYMAEWLRAVYNNQMGFVKHQYIEVFPAQTTHIVTACQRYGAALLKKGQSNSNIAVLKQDLHQLGWTNLTLNRSFDDATYQAVKEFQGQHGLSQDGIVGNATKEALFLSHESG